MYIVRQAKKEDLEDLYELSKLENFLNLPNDIEKLTKNIHKSINSFTSNDFNPQNTFLFVLEDLSENKVIGTSVIHSQHGTSSIPHFALKVGKEYRRSYSVDQDFTHTTLRLHVETEGPTEIGGLVLAPKYRGNSEKLGKQIAFSRFLYMAFNQVHFRKEVHAELLPPFNEDGSAPLWEALGKKFFNMEYQKADILSRKNKEFILNLFPAENIYANLLSEKAQQAIGAVNKNTVPLKNMLEKIGFKYIEQIDPFDGGPHYRSMLEEIKPIKNKIKQNFEYTDNADMMTDQFLIRSNKDKEFIGFKARGSHRENTLCLENSEMTQRYLEAEKEIELIYL